MIEFFHTVRSFIYEYLPKQKSVSENTRISYNTAIELFVTFMREEKKYSAKQISYMNIDRDLIIEFLDWLENARRCKAATRNQRLMALRAFFNYAGILDCTQTALYIDTLNIPLKADDSKVISYLSESALAALLKQPDIKKKTELRNLTFMVLMYDTAARCSELLNMRIRDLKLNCNHPIAYLHGKGGKTRTVPLLDKTVQHCKRYLKRFHPNEKSGSEEYLFYTVSHKRHNQMSHDTVAYFLKKYADAAALECPEMPEIIRPHMIRHTRAMHLYQHDMPLNMIMEYLGHASIETTRIYAYADTEMKRAALQKIESDNPAKSIQIGIWEEDEEMILKLIGR